MRKKILIPLLLIATLAYSQEKPKLPKTDANFKKYLDDGRRELLKNAFKIHFDGLVNTELSAVYERKLSPTFSIEVGTGIIPKYTALWENILNLDGGLLNADSLKPKGMGYSFQILPKIYSKKSAIDKGMYIGVLLKQRSFTNNKSEKIIYREIAYHQGYQYLVNKNICLDLGYGFGFAKYKVYNDSYYNNYTDKWEPFSISCFTYHLRIGVGIFFGENLYNEKNSKVKKSKKGDIEDEE